MVCLSIDVLTTIFLRKAPLNSFMYRLKDFISYFKGAIDVISRSSESADSVLEKLVIISY